MERPVTISDIARLAGVAESTVSRALADSPLVAQKTKERIQNIARDHNYVMNINARSLRMRQTWTIQVVIPQWHAVRGSVSDPFMLSLVGAVADELSVQGYDLLLSKSPPWADDGAERGPQNALITGRADGIILMGQGENDQPIRDLAERHRPVVVWGGYLPGTPYCVVGSDNEAGGRRAAEHLIKAGRRRIAFLGDTRRPEVALRHKGYRTALEQAGLPVIPSLTVDAQFDPASAKAASKSLLSRGESFDAVLAASDILAMGAIAEARSQGLAVPDDIAVVGFDDIASAAYYTPSLTTVRQKVAEGGRLLVERVLGLAAGREAPPAVLATELVVRDSCGSRINQNPGGN